MATSRRPPKMGRPSTQLACARASRYMKGERPALSGAKPLAATLPWNTSFVRRVSMSTRSSNAQVIKPVKAIRLGEIMVALPLLLLNPSNNQRTANIYPVYAAFQLVKVDCYYGDGTARRDLTLLPHQALGFHLFRRKCASLTTKGDKVVRLYKLAISPSMTG